MTLFNNFCKPTLCEQCLSTRIQTATTHLLSGKSLRVDQENRTPQSSKMDSGQRPGWSRSHDQYIPCPRTDLVQCVIPDAM